MDKKKQYRALIGGWIAAFLVTLPIARLLLSEKTFIPNALADSYAVLACMCCGIALNIALNRAEKKISPLDKVRIAYARQQAGIKPPAPLLKKTLPFFIVFFTLAALYSGAFLYMGEYYTKFYGKPFQDYLLVSDKSYGRDRGCSYLYKLKSPQFTGVLGLRMMCIDKDTHEQLPKTMGILIVKGKISSWGRNIDDYELPKKEENLQWLYNQRESLIERWKK